MSSLDENKKVKTNKWKDPDFVKEYYRKYHRSRRVYKLHPYKLDNGRRWAGVYEFPPNFESKEAYEKFKKERQQSYKKKSGQRVYVPSPRVKCELCECEILQGKWQGHINGTKHKKNEALLEKHGVAVSAQA